MPSPATRLPAVLFCLLAACTSRTQGPQGAVAVTAADDSLDAVGVTTQMSAVLLDSQGRPMENSGFAWSSNNPAIATVNAAGVVTAQGNGTAVISARSDRNVTGTANVVVEQLPASIEISPEDWPVAQAWIGARRQFGVTVRDANGNEIANPVVDWSASDEGVIRVDDSGLATAMNDGTDVLVTAAAGAVMDSLNVTVYADGGNGPGTIYSVWYARSDDAPAILANGKIYTPDTVLTNNLAYRDPIPPWPHSRPTVHKFQWEGDRIGILTDMADGSGTFRVRNRIGEWINAAVADVVDFQLEGNLIGIRERGGLMRVNDGTSGPWTVLAAEGAADFQIEDNRIAVLHDDGLLQVRTGIAGAWTDVVPAGDQIRFELENNRTVVLHSDGTLRAKDSLANPWTDLGTNVTDFRLWGNRIAFTDASGIFRVQDGLGDTPTVLASAPLAQFELEGNRIGILFESGLFRVKDGIQGGWTDLATDDVRAFQLQENLIGILHDSTSVVTIKHGANGAWSSVDGGDYPGIDQNVTQFRLVVDVPTPPKRTSLTAYDNSRVECAAIGQDGDPYNCYPEPYEWLPVSLYGYFCGALRPADFNNTIAAVTSIDGLDEACKHHDLVNHFYPEFDEGWDGDIFGACIVRYAITHGRLTRDGVLLTHGGDSQAGWDDGWAAVDMPMLKFGLDEYFIDTNLCNSEDLASFTSVTASQR